MMIQVIILENEKLWEEYHKKMKEINNPDPSKKRDSIDIGGHCFSQNRQSKIK